MESEKISSPQQKFEIATTQVSVAEGAPAERKDIINIGGMLRVYLKYWWVFLISLIFCGGVAFWYMKKKTPIYLEQGLIMVNQQEDGGMGHSGGMMSLLSSMGFGSTTGANPENEVFKMNSRSMLVNIIDTLNLRTSYWQSRGFFKRRINYYQNEPISVSIPRQIADTISVSTTFHLHGPLKGPWTLNIEQDKEKFQTEVSKLPYNAKTPYGYFHIEATKDFPVTGEELNVSAIYLCENDVVDWLQENLSADYVSNKADAIQINMGDPIIKRGKDIVNTLMNLYNEHREEDRLEFNHTQLKFIDDRLISLYKELENSEAKIEQFKKTNNIVSPEAEAQYLYTRKGVMDESAVTLQANIQILEMIQQMLSAPDTQYTMIPFSGMTGANEGYTQLIGKYNELVMQRMTLASSAKSGNPALTKVEEQIEAMRNNILNSVTRELQSARISEQTLAGEQGKDGSRMGQFPSIEHDMVTLYRDREVQNTIYGFLLQKREETQIALAQNQPVGKIIDYAYAVSKPISPKPMLVYGIAVVFGIGIPLFLLRTHMPKHTKKAREKRKKK